MLNFPIHWLYPYFKRELYATLYGGGQQFSRVIDDASLMLTMGGDLDPETRVHYYNGATPCAA